MGRHHVAPKTLMEKRALEAVRAIVERYPGATSALVAVVILALRVHGIPSTPESAATLRAVADLIDSPIGDPPRAPH